MTDLHDLSELAQRIPTPEAPTPQVRQRAKDQLMNHINSTTSSSTTGSSTAGPSTTSLDARRAKRSRRRTIGIGALATAAAVAGLVLSGISINGKDGVSGPAPAGAAELLKLSKIAASAELPGSGEILHSQTIWDQSGSGVEVDGTRTSRHRRQVRDIWVFPDRTWILRNDYGVVGTAVETERFGLTEPDSLFADMSEGLPNDFAALKAKLTRNAEGGGSSPNGELFVLATDALRESKASPEEHRSSASSQKSPGSNHLARSRIRRVAAASDSATSKRTGYIRTPSSMRRPQRCWQTARELRAALRRQSERS